MKDFRATTSSGANYDVRHGRVIITGSSLPDTSFTIGKMYSSVDPQGFPWTEGDQSWAEADIAVVGERLALVGLNEWRISSEIASVMELDTATIEAAAAALSHMPPNERYRLIEESLERFALNEQGPDPIEARPYRMDTK